MSNKDKLITKSPNKIIINRQLISKALHPIELNNFNYYINKLIKFEEDRNKNMSYNDK